MHLKNTEFRQSSTQTAVLSTPARRLLSFCSLTTLRDKHGRNRSLQGQHLCRTHMAHIEVRMDFPPGLFKHRGTEKKSRGNL